MTVSSRRLEKEISEAEALAKDRLTSPFGHLLFPIVWIVAFFIFLVQAPGRIVFDTKIDLLVNPAGLLSSLWNLWNPNMYFGILQDQYQGYVWPMGPFFLICSKLAVPMWVAERAWETTVFAIAFWGMVRLCESLDLGTRDVRLFAGLMFSLWPTFTVLIGSTSGAILPGVLLPATLFPLIKAANNKMPILKAALWSGVAIASMGGINATSTFVGLILPICFLITRKGSRRIFSLAKWWVLCLFIAVAWWLLPLLFLGHYGFNFLPYVEQSHTTESTTSATEVLRGDANWTAYLLYGNLPNSDIRVLAGGGNPAPHLGITSPWIPAGWQVSTNPFIIMAGVILAGIGMFGLARKDMPERLFLILSFSLGLLFVTAGYWGPLGGLLTNPIQAILNGAFAPLRNIYKFEPEMGVCLTLGFCHSINLLNAYLRKIWRPRFPIRRSTLLRFGSILLIVPLSLPFLTGNILNAGSFKSVPSYWYQLASYLKKVSPYNPVLVVPALDQGTFTWGTSVDMPLEPLASTPWVWLNQVPFSGAGARRFLDYVEQVFATGNVPPGFSTFLERAGITYIVADNDTDWQSADSPSPAKVHAVLSEMNYVEVAGFGPTIPSQDFLVAPYRESLKPPTFQALQVYAPYNLTTGPPSPYPVVSLNASKAVFVSGSSGAVGQGVSGGLIAPDEPVFTTGFLPNNFKSKVSSWIETDDLARTNVNFGLLNSNTSYTLKANEPAPLNSPGGQGGLTPKQILPLPHLSQSVAIFKGPISNISASSYGSWYFTLPQFAPYNILSDNPNVFWSTGTPNEPIGQWIRINFRNKISIPYLELKMIVNDMPNRAYATSVAVSTQGGTISSNIKRTNNLQALSTAPGLTNFLKITITGVKNFTPGGPGVGFNDLTIPGIKQTVRYIKLPANLALYKLASQMISISSKLASPNFELGGIYTDTNRAFSVRKPGFYTVSGTALPVVNNALELYQSSFQNITVSASSVLGNIPFLAPVSLFDKNRNGGWISSETKSAQLTISWGESRFVNSIKFFFLRNLAAPPTKVIVTSANYQKELKIPPSGSVDFSGVLTNKLTLTLLGPRKEVAINQITGYLSQLPIGLKAIYIPALKDLYTPEPAPTTPITLPCGDGPSIMIDGHNYETSLSGTLEDLIAPIPLTVHPCFASIYLSKGMHYLISSSDSSVSDLDSLSIAPSTFNFQPTNDTQVLRGNRQLRVLSWGAQSRQIQIGNGPESILEIHQDYNAGWSATLNGVNLQPVVLDGFQQGFVIPANSYGLITLNYTPNFIYKLGFSLAAFALALMFLFAISTLFGKLKKPDDKLPPLSGRSLNSNKAYFLATLLIVLISSPYLLIAALIISQLLYWFEIKKKLDLKGLLIIGFLIGAGIVAAINPSIYAGQSHGTFSPLAQILAFCSFISFLTASFDWLGPVLVLFAPLIYRWRKYRYKKANVS